MKAMKDLQKSNPAMGFNPDAGAKVGNHIVTALREDPSCGASQEIYKLEHCCAPLLHWICGLQFPHFVLEATYEVNPT